MFNWLDFVKLYRIPYVTEGPNTKRGNISVRCPMCGDADPSEHMGLNLSTGEFGCWRDRSHRGKSPNYLVAILLGCSFTEAKEIVEEAQVSPASVDTLEDMAGRLFEPEIFAETAISTIELPDEFQPLTIPYRTGSSQSPFYDYLMRRKFDHEDIPAIVNQYYLHYCTRGYWKDRLIIPFIVDSCYVGWTGRAIVRSRHRYLSYPSSGVVKQIIYNGDVSGNTLVIVEGPLDAIKYDYYAQEYGVRAAAVLGVAVTDRQIAILHRLARGFRRVVMLLDDDALATSFAMTGQLAGVGAKSQALPDGIHDPGDMTREQVRASAREIALA